MKNHQTKTSLLSYNTKNRYRNKIESEGGISLPFPSSNVFFFFNEQGKLRKIYPISFLLKKRLPFCENVPLKPLGITPCLVKANRCLKHGLLLPPGIQTPFLLHSCFVIGGGGLGGGGRRKSAIVWSCEEGKGRQITFLSQWQLSICQVFFVFITS